MNKLMYVDKDEDQHMLLRDDEMNFDNIIRLVRALFERGIKFVGLETTDVRMYFDSAKNAGNQGITGKFKDKMFIK